jgi:hypothetical protein
MEEGHQKSKRLSYTAKFKREVVHCTDEKGYHEATAILGVKSVFDCGGNSRQQSSLFFHTDGRLE